jgi:phosphinothricin acetyltransferase
LPARPEELDRDRRDLRPGNREGRWTADTEPLGPERRSAWQQLHAGEDHPMSVAQGGVGVIGTAAWHRPGRRALRRVAEIAYYVERAQRGRGVGLALIAHALEQVPRCGLRHRFAILLDTNTASIHLLERSGFARWGHLPGIAEFDGRFTCGQLIYSRALVSCAAEPAP